MHFLLILLTIFTLSSCSINEQNSTAGCSIKQYDNSHLLDGNLQYEAPSNWEKITPESSMRIDEYIIDKNSNTKLGVFFFKDMKNQVEENISRWKSQFADDDTRHLISKKQFNCDGKIPVTIYHIAGTYLEKLDPMNPQSQVQTKTDYALIGVVAETKSGTWFFKAVGPSSVIDEQRDAVDDLVSTFNLIK